MRRDHSTVPSFPKISAEILDEVTAKVTVSGIVSSVTGTDLNATRAEVVRLISLTAKRLGRPVRALTVEGGEEWPLVIYPDGVVESDTTADPGKRKGRKKQAGRGSKAKGGTAPRTPDETPAPSGPSAADAFVSGGVPHATAVPGERPPAPEMRVDENTEAEPVRPRPATPSLFEMVVQSLEERDRALSAEQNRNPAPEPPPVVPQGGAVRSSVDASAPAPLSAPGSRFPGPGPVTAGSDDAPGPEPHGPSAPTPAAFAPSGRFSPEPAPREGAGAMPPAPSVPAPQPPSGYAHGVSPHSGSTGGPAPDSTPPVSGPPPGPHAPRPAQGGHRTPPPHRVLAGQPTTPAPAPQPAPGYGHGTPSHGVPAGPPPGVPVPPAPRPGPDPEAEPLPADLGSGAGQGGAPAALTGPSEAAELWNTVIQEINSERGAHPGTVPPVHPIPAQEAVGPPISAPPSRRRRFGLGGLLGPRVPEWSAPPENFHARMQVPIAGHRRIAVLSLKGGVGKTTTSVLLGSLMASQRESRVVAVDVNRDMGTLRDRVPLQTGLTVRDLFRDAASIRGFTELRGYVSANEERMHALVGDQVFGFREVEGRNGYGVVADVLERYYDIVLNDCGTGMGNPGMQRVLDLADQVVVVLEPASDAVRAAEATFDWLGRNGYADLVSGAIVVISKVDRRSASSPDIDTLEARFSGTVRAAVRIPFDEHLAWGRVIRFQELHESTRNACSHLALLSVEGLANMQRSGV